MKIKDIPTLISFQTTKKVQGHTRKIMQVERKESALAVHIVTQQSLKYELQRATFEDGFFVAATRDFYFYSNFVSD